LEDLGSWWSVVMSLSMSGRKLGATLLVIGLFAAVVAEPAHAVANYSEQAGPSPVTYRWYGVAGKTYTYAWQSGNRHVSSLYARARYGDFNYIEMGVGQKNVGETARVFMAYENWPDTIKYYDHRYQVQVWTSYYPAAGTWVSHEINNHQIGGSNWYAAYNSTTLLHGLKLYIGDGSTTGETQCFLDTSAERWTGTTTDNHHSAAWLKKKDSNGNWSDWGSIAVAGNDPIWKMVVGSSKWAYTTYQ